MTQTQGMPGAQHRRNPYGSGRGDRAQRNLQCRKHHHAANRICTPATVRQQVLSRPDILHVGGTDA